MNEAVRPPGAIDSRELRRALGQFATGVTVVTCRAADGTLTGMTANSFASVSLNPPLVLWSLDKNARSYGAFAAAERFAISVLGQDQVETSNRFAQPGADKFAAVAWQEGAGGVPLMPDPAAVFECVTHTTFEGGDHLIIIGEVIRFERHERAPLVFAGGRYGAVAPHPGTALASEDEPVERHPYDDFLVPLLFRAYNHLFNRFASSLEAEGSTGAEMRILSILSSGGSSGEGRLLTATMLSQSSYEEARDALLAAGRIAWNGGTLAITGSGERKLADLLRHAVERERQATGGLDATEVELLRTLLRKLVRTHEDVQ